MICEYCGQRLTLVNGEYWAVKYQGGEGLIDGTTELCSIPIDKGNWGAFRSHALLVPHKPSKSSIINAILKEI